MKKKFKNIGILACLAILFLFVSDAFTVWRYNPFTRKLDYYSIDIGAGLVGEATGDVLYHDGTNWTNLPIGAATEVLAVSGAGIPNWVAAGAPGAHQASHEIGGADLVDHDNLTNFVGNEHLLVGAIDHDSLLNYVFRQHVDIANVFYVAAVGGEYATITAALNAENAVGNVFLIGPGTYAGDQIDFTANGQTVIGMGEMDDVHVTQADTTVIPFGAFTDCVVKNVHVEVTAPTTAAADVITGTGGLTLYDVHVELSNTNVVVADQPACIDTTGIVQMFNGLIEYANTGNDGDGTTAIKAAVRIGAGAVMWFDHTVFSVSGGNQSLALTSSYATAGLISFYKCYIDVNDDASSNTIGVTYSNVAAGTHEMYMNDIHVDNSANIAHGVFLINADTIRSVYNHIHVTGATAYGLNAQAGTTIISQLDDIVATTPTQGAGTITYVHSHSDGNFRVSGTLYGATYGSDGSITDAEFLYINTLGSNAQTQLNGKQALDAALTDLSTVATTAGRYLRVAAADDFEERTVANVLVDLSGNAASAFAWNGQNLTGIDSIYIVEQAEADADIGGSGQIWVDAGNPNTLWFTNEDGTDLQLGVGGDAFTLKVDVGATADYFGVAGGDGLFRFTANHFTMADGGNFVTLSLADHATARIALGLQIGTDVQAQNAVLTELTALTDPGADEFPFYNDTTENWEFSTVLFPTATGVNVGAAGNFGKLELEDDDGDVLSHQVGDQAGDTPYTWPTAFGTTGFVLSSTDAGTMSWVANAGGGTLTTIKENNVGVGDADIIILDFLGADFIVAEAPDTEVQVSFDYPNSQKATTAQPGILTELATIVETNAGVDTTRAVTPDALEDWTGGTTGTITTLGTIATGIWNAGAVTVANGSSISLEEDITYTGATGVNLIKFPDHLAEALVLEEGGTSYQTFVTTNGSEEIQMNVGVQFDTIAYFIAEYDEGAEGGAFTIDWTNGQKQKVTITGVNLDMSFTDPPGPCNLMLKIVQGDGDDTIDWTHDTKIGGAGGTAPTLSTGNADEDVFGIYFDGTNYWISVMLDIDLFT